MEYVISVILMYVITMISNNFFTTQKNSPAILQLLLKNKMLRGANGFQCLAI